ncbi:MAG: hypothetical protein KatS3mg031_2988 [Chitinophagales bacterium]|nr:MAG: hypothetical protein KatS3mg031_2917 [Chitinophagales bacterium]GIV35453.1 MAG: hypothetical protein KatS3mg031_2988 [Chitinophagales bacterium]
MAKNVLNYDRRVTLRRKSPASQGATGEVAFTWQDIKVLPAAIEWQQAGGEEIEAEQLRSVQPVKFVLRHDSTTSTITARDRLFYAGEEYDIVRVVEGPRRGANIILIAKLRR